MAFGGDTGSDGGGSSLRPSVFQRFFAVQIKENLESHNWAPTGAFYSECSGLGVGVHLVFLRSPVLYPGAGQRGG